MSVLKNKRHVSKAEYVNVAWQISIETINFISRLSARYSRLLAEHISKLALEVCEYTEKANSVLPKDEVTIKFRKENLINARGSLRALDVELTRCYEILLLNPEGAFSHIDKKQKALKKLDSMAQTLGNMIVYETNLLNGVLKSDQSINI